jgi:hypothetical protein
LGPPCRAAHEGQQISKATEPSPRERREGRRNVRHPASHLSTPFSPPPSASIYRRLLGFYGCRRVPEHHRLHPRRPQLAAGHTRRPPFLSHHAAAFRRAGVRDPSGSGSFSPLGNYPTTALASICLVQFMFHVQSFCFSRDFSRGRGRAAR